MRVKIGEDTWEVNWKHDVLQGNKSFFTGIPGAKNGICKGITYCQISKNRAPVNCAPSYCGLEEPNFVKSIGRKHSFRRAVKGLPKDVSHDLRKQFFLEFEAKCATIEEYRARRPWKFSVGTILGSGAVKNLLTDSQGYVFESLSKTENSGK